MLSKFQVYYSKHTKLIVPIIIVIGFIIDVITLNKIDQFFDNAVFIFHIFISLVIFTIIFAENTKAGRWLAVTKNKVLYETLMLFSFGALFSGFTIVYFRSGSFFASWPFIIATFALMIGIEIKKDYFREKNFQFTIIYFSLLSYSIIFFPLILKKVDDWVFILGGVVSLIIIYFYLNILSVVHKSTFKVYKYRFYRSTLLVFFVINILYFTNIIPPVPLSLKFKAVYHDVQKVKEGEYLGTYELGTAMQLFRHRSRVVHREINDDIFVFTEIYAPAGIQTDVSHVWQRFDSDSVSWVTSNTIPLSIAGGREEGYRGYSKKTNLDDGRWRVVVENKRGQKLGYIHFKIINGKAPEVLFDEVL